MNIKTLLPTLTAAVLLSACGSIVPKPQTDLFTIAKFESENTIVSQISNPERQIIACWGAPPKAGPLSKTFTKTTAHAKFPPSSFPTIKN